MNENSKKNNSILAPIVLFVYNRPDHTKRTLEAIKQNELADESDLYIFSDGPKKNDKESLNKVNDVRNIIHGVTGFKSVNIVEQTENQGLGKSIIKGVSDIINNYSKIIVLEDDIVTSKYFLRFMNDALNKYESVENVMQISGYTPPIEKKGLPDTFFMSWPDCWGWATWKRVWDKFERNPEKLMENSNKQDIYKININGTNSGMWNQIVDNHEGILYTWAIFFHSMVVKNKGLTLYCRNCLVENIGFDGSGDNCGLNDSYTTDISKERVEIRDIEIKKLKLAEKRYMDFNKKISRNDLVTRIKRKIKKVIGKC